MLGAPVIDDVAPAVKLTEAPVGPRLETDRAGGLATRGNKPDVGRHAEVAP